MKIICEQCKYEYIIPDDKNIATTCPRCGKINTNYIKCENCKGCSLLKGCKKAERGVFLAD